MATDKITKGYTKNMSDLNTYKLAKQIADEAVDNWINRSVLLYVGCSSWTSHGRNHAVHYADEITRKPICKKEYKGGALDVFHGDISEVTCTACKLLVKRMPVQQ